MTRIREEEEEGTNNKILKHTETAVFGFNPKYMRDVLGKLNIRTFYSELQFTVKSVDRIEI